MESNNIFHPTRFFLLLREEFSTKYRTALIALGAVAIVTMFFATIRDSNIHETWFPTLVLGGGFLFTSLAFNNWINKPGRQFYLHLPASNFEKFASKWLITALIYPIVIVGFYQVLIWVLASVTSETYQLFYVEGLDIFHENNVKIFKAYFVLQSIFLLGAASFNRFAILKTLFTLFVVGIALGLIGFTSFRLIFAEYWTGFETVGAGPQIDEDHKNWVEGPLFNFVQNLFWYALAPVALLIGFLKLKEKEV